MNDYPYLPPTCRKNHCDHDPDRCLRYRSRRCLSGECTHARQNLLCAVNYPTTALPLAPAQLADLLLTPTTNPNTLHQQLARQLTPRAARRLLAAAHHIAAERLWTDAA